MLLLFAKPDRRNKADLSKPAGLLFSLSAVAALALPACGSSTSAPSPTPPPTTGRATFTVTFDQNPVPFMTGGCSFSTPSGWSTSARIQETAGVAYTPSTLTQKLDGAIAGMLNESFGSRFGACSNMSFTPGMILANGAVCGVVGVCTTTATYHTYQFSITGTDANGHSVTIDSPMLQFSGGPASASATRF